MLLPANAPAWIDRLLTWLEPFEASFGHKAQRGAFRRYLLGLLSDSPRKSMSAMLTRVSDPGSYQAFQHFLTHAPWDAERLWRQLRGQIPARTGVLILDGTGFPKQGTRSVGVARQYSGTLGKIGNCQVAVTAALWTGAQAWFLGRGCISPDAWLTPAQRALAQIAPTVRFQEKWRLALTLLRQVRAAGFRSPPCWGMRNLATTPVCGRALHRAGLPYALGMSSTSHGVSGRADVARPVHPPAASPGPPALPAGVTPIAVQALVASGPRDSGAHPVAQCVRPRTWTGRFAAARVTPAHAWRQQLLPEIWLLAEQDTGARPMKYYLIDLPAHDLVARARATGAPTLGDRATVPGAQGRAGPRSLRRPLAARLEPPRRADGVGVYVSADRTTASRVRSLTLPQVRAILREVLTAHFFVTRPRYLQRMLALQDVVLRI